MFEISPSLCSCIAVIKWWKSKTRFLQSLHCVRSTEKTIRSDNSHAWLHCSASLCWMSVQNNFSMDISNPNGSVACVGKCGRELLSGFSCHTDTGSVVQCDRSHRTHLLWIIDLIVQYATTILKHRLLCYQEIIHFLSVVFRIQIYSEKVRDLPHNPTFFWLPNSHSKAITKRFKQHTHFANYWF